MVERIGKNVESMRTKDKVRKISHVTSGQAVLFVGLYNPKGPSEEVQVKHTGRNTFTVNYYIRERSDYMLIVMWGDAHVPGSPFNVEVSLK
ncbi:hypothetical protein HA402_000475 [Bradysia odoriphaga]|nr:hypothetical protein HA402_000475 [Bradysia odoriphaga]